MIFIEYKNYEEYEKYLGTLIVTKELLEMILNTEIIESNLTEEEIEIRFNKLCDFSTPLRKEIREASTLRDLPRFQFANKVNDLLHDVSSKGISRKLASSLPNEFFNQMEEFYNTGIIIKK